jgi:ribosomal protein S18 acetylase RimI-like enzyme
MQIQQLTPVDHERLRTIRLRALRDAPDAFSSTFEETLARPRESWVEQLEKLATFVATLDGHDVGMVRIARPDTGATASLLSMWVAPEARRRGVGTALLDAAIAWTRARGFTRLRLEVVDDNTAAVELYTRKGFQPTGRTSTMPAPRQHIREHERILELG